MYKIVLSASFFTLAVMAADQPNTNQSNFVIASPNTVKVQYWEEFRYLKNGELYAGKKDIDTLTLNIDKSSTHQQIEDRLKRHLKVNGTLSFESTQITPISDKDRPILDCQKASLHAVINQWCYKFVADKTDEIRESDDDNQ